MWRMWAWTAIVGAAVPLRAWQSLRYSHEALEDRVREMGTWVPTQEVNLSVRASVTRTLDALLGPKHGVTVVYSESAFAASAGGLRKHSSGATIVVPLLRLSPPVSWVPPVDAAGLAFLVAHEAAHLARDDPLVADVLPIALATPIIPMMHVLARRGLPWTLLVPAAGALLVAAAAAQRRHAEYSADAWAVARLEGVAGVDPQLGAWEALRGVKAIQDGGGGGSWWGWVLYPDVMDRMTRVRATDADVLLP